MKKEKDYKQLVFLFFQEIFLINLCFVRSTFKCKNFSKIFKKHLQLAIICSIIALSL